MKSIIYAFLFILFTNMLYAGNLDDAATLFKEKKYPEAAQIFQDILKKNDTSAVANYYLGRIRYVQKKYDDAADFAERAVELNPSVADYHFWYANALGAKAQQTNIFKQAWLAPKILRQFQKTIELDSTHIGGHIGAANFYLLAPGFMGGDIDKAMHEAHTLIRLGSDKGYWLLASIYDKQGKSDKAEKQYDLLDKSFNDSTGNPGFYNNFGYFLIKRRKPVKAIKMFKRLVQLRPQDANSYDSLGDGFRAAGKLDSAKIAYRQALDIDPAFKASLKKLKELNTP